MSRKILPGLVVALVLFPCLSCDDGRKPPFNGYVTRSANFEYHNETPEALCPTLMPLLERHLASFESLTGLNLTPPSFRYYRFSNFPELGRFGCPSDCTRDDVVYAVARFDSHELFHVYAFRASGVTTSIGLLEEGLATAFACSPVRSNGDYHPGDWRNFVNVAEKLADLSDPDIADQYAAAGAFVAFLYYTFGWDKLALLYRSLRRGDDATALEGAVLSVYGADMDTLWQDSRTFPNKRICITDWTCWSSPVVLNEETRQECDGELHRSIELSEPSSVALFATHPVMLWQDCLAEPGPIFVLGQNSFPSVTWVSLAAGSFNLTRTSGSESINPRVYPASFSLELTSQIPGSFLASSCEAAQAIPLDPQVETRILFPSTASLSGWVRVDGPAAAVFSVVSDQLQTDIPNYPGGALHGDTSFCDSCSTDANCQAISSQVSLAFSGGGVLRLTNVYAVSFPEMGFPNAGFHISPM